MKRRCNNCYFGDICNGTKKCSHYTPFEYETDDDEIEQLIEQRRVEYRIEWLEYAQKRTDFFEI